MDTELTNTTNQTTVTNNSADSTGQCSGSVHDIGFNKDIRIMMLFLIICLNVIGSVMVVFWITNNSRKSSSNNNNNSNNINNSNSNSHFSRVNIYIMNLTVADFLVISLALLPQILWEYADQAWAMGPVMCRLLKLMQTFSITSSSYMLVVIAVDRHHAILYPLKPSLKIWKVTATGWIMAFIVVSPILGLFHIIEIDGQIQCENIFRGKPKWHRQLWITYVTCAAYLLPLLFLAICYARIVLQIYRSASRNKNRLGGTNAASLQKAKMKTLKMTCVIIVAFMICGFPYCTYELILSYGDHCLVSPEMVGFLGVMAAFNSAVNPYIFLAFNVKCGFAKCWES